MNFNKKIAALAAGTAVLIPGAVWAWPAPTASAGGGVCVEGVRRDVKWVVRNNESGYVKSPAYVTGKVTPDFGVSAFDPTPIPNTGHNVGVAYTKVPGDYSGKVRLDYVMEWKGKDGGDKQTGTISVEVVKCEKPVTTTTTTLAPVTSTTGSSTTTTRISTTPTTTAPTSTRPQPANPGSSTTVDILRPKVVVVENPPYTG